MSVNNRIGMSVPQLLQVRYRLRSGTVLRVALSLALGVAAGGVAASAAADGTQTNGNAAGTAVGEVSMVLGKAWLHSPDGSKIAVKAGTAIGVADSIETSSNGHVHVRFVDQGLVVVRPSSTLDIQRYDYDPRDPAASAVKLHLREGAARSISGAAAEAAKQNYRLNTPLAAIGVRGTDFVVNASAGSVSAQVMEGAIVLAPFSSECSALALGPCSSNALELTGDAGQIAVLAAGSLQATLLPRPDTDIPEALLQGQAQPLLAASGPEAEEDGAAAIVTDSVTARAVSRKISDGQQLAQPAPVTPAPPTLVPPPTLSPAAPAPLPAVFTPAAAIPEAQLTSNSQLVWGRWSNINAASERITASLATAASEGRELAVAGDSYALYRQPQDAALSANPATAAIRPGLGTLGFTLNMAQAQLTRGNVRELMDVYGGLLNINFDQRLFSTSLQLGHAATGRFEYSDAGRVTGTLFSNRSENQITTGAVSLDGKEAGYFFQTTLPAGGVEGITLWSVKP